MRCPASVKDVPGARPHAPALIDEPEDDIDRLHRFLCGIPNNTDVGFPDLLPQLVAATEMWVRESLD